MGRATLLIRSAAPALALLALLSLPLAPLWAGQARPAAAPGFPVRMVKLGGPLDDPATLAYLEFCHRAGFNALWVYSPVAGRWKPAAAPDGPYVLPAFVELVRWCRDRGIRVVVSVNPVADPGGRFVFSDRQHRRRLVEFVRRLRREAGVRDFVVSFDDQPTELTELRDVLRYGLSAAPAHLAVLRQVARGLSRRDRLWFCAAAYADEHLDQRDHPYVQMLLEGLPRLPSRVGMVWTGPQVISRRITSDSVRRVRELFGGRQVLLYDNYPVNVDGKRRALALLLGPLRERDPRLPEHVAVYLACPMNELGASRLPLLTIADYLHDPTGYDPETSWERAREQLAGDDPQAREALRVQALEWGGWVSELNYRTGVNDNVKTALRGLSEPAVMSSWRWVADRYPQRMQGIARIADESLREDLLTRMEARLAVAQALPLIREYRARLRAGRRDVDELLQRLHEIGARTATHDDARERYQRFLDQADLPLERSPTD